MVPASQSAAKATFGQAGTVGIAQQDDPTEPARAAYRRATSTWNGLMPFTS